MKIVMKELIIALVIMAAFVIMFSMFPLALHAGLFTLTLASIVLMFGTKNTTLNVVGMFLIAGVIFSFMMFHGL